MGTGLLLHALHEALLKHPGHLVAGLLGRATKHLPVGCNDDEGTWNFGWKFDDNGYPTYFTDDNSYNWEGTYFSWK